MPGLVAFGRRWSVGSDDLFVPSVCLCFIHSVWLITTLIAVVSESEFLWSKADKVPCSNHVWQLVALIVLLLAACFLLEAGLTIVSLRGSILTDAPRKPAQYIIYILLTVLAGKLIWSGFAVAWLYQFYLDCSLHFLKQVILGLVICTWLIFLGVIMTAWCTYDVAGRSWVKMKRYQANMKEMELKNPAYYRRSGSRHRNWRQRKVIRAYQNSWNHRCRLLFCCMHRTERHRDSFTDLAKLLSEFFRDLDVVPTDVVVGLLLLRRLQRLEQCSIVKTKRNNTYEFLSGIAITPKTKFVAMNDPIDLEIFRNVVHFMHYASAAYGWPWYIIPHGVKGVCNLCSNLSCCCCRRGCRRARLQADLSDVVVEDNCCYCNYAVIPTMFDPDTFEVVHATYHVDVGETPYFVVIDYEKEAVVVSIRGTLSLKDVITDLNAEGEPLPLNPPREDWQGHKGMIQAAVYMKAQLVGQKILEKAFNRVREKRTAESFRLVIVGHSLGAGTATILAVLLKEEYPNLQCYAYSPPGGLLSMPVVEYTKEFVTSVIVGKDVVPRIGLSQMEALRADLLNAIKKSRKPKWHTILSGMTCCFCVKPEFALPQRLSSAPSIQSEEFMRSRRSLRDLREVTINPNESAISLTVHQPLYPPGRIMHIVRHHPKKDEIKYETMWRKLTKKGEPVFQALWTENTDYGQVLISPGMIQDHMPDQVLRALHRVVNNHGPAKPQRTLAASTSPLMLSRDSLVMGDSGSKSSPNKICMENVSFANNSSSSKPSPECTLMNPNPLIIDADAEVENDGELTPTNMGLTDLLAKFNLSWDYVTNLQERYLEKEDIMLRQQQYLPPEPPLPPCGHERRGSFDNSSSGCSDVGSTFKEIFGPIKYDEWMAPLASPETLSEISSLSSRASFLIPKDQSPLLGVRMKGMKNGTSSSLHRYKNGKANGFGLGTPCSTFHNGNHHHSRSFSCTYPEISDVSIISSGLCGQSHSTKGSFYYGSCTNGGSKIRVNDNNGGEEYSGNSFGVTSGPENGKCHFIVTESDYQSESHHHFSEKDTTNGHGKSDDIQLTPTGDSPTHDEPMRAKANGDTKRVSFNLKKKYASKDSGCSVGDVSYTPSTPGRYDPVYPIFSHQEEYGVPTLNEPHYNYCGQSPQESPQNRPSTIAYKQQDDPQNPAFQFPILNEILTEINARAANASNNTIIHIPADEPEDEQED